MRHTGRKRLLGIVLATPALFFLFVLLFFNGIVVRGKGFPAPLIDTEHFGEAAACALIALFGAWLSISRFRAG
jgi:hypothetical protein